MQYCRKCPDAVAQIQGGMEAPQLTGCVEFYQENGCVLIVARISGLPKEITAGCPCLPDLRRPALPDQSRRKR